MTYAGSFNTFTFGNKARPGASVRSLSGWKDKVATVQSTVGATRNTTASPRFGPMDVRLVLNLHASSGAELETLIDRAMAAFAPSAAILPLTIAGRTKWVQIVSAVPELNPDWPGAEVTSTLTVQALAEDPVLYSAEQTTAALWATEDPVTGDTFEAANGGNLVPGARRVWDLRMTANGGSLVNPFVNVDHDDGTYEHITFQGTLTAGQVLRVQSDLLPYVGSALRSGWIRSTCETGPTSRVARWWLLHPSTGTDGKNAVTVGATSGSFSGYLKTRAPY